MKMKLVRIYVERNGGRILINATKSKGDTFVAKIPASKYGRPLRPKASDEEIGRAVREVLKNCD